MFTTTRIWLHSFSVVLAFGAVLLLLPGRTSAALTNNVPLNWNVSTSTNGAYLEDFNAVPNWASVAGQTISSVTDRTGPFPSRSNVWFAAAAVTNVLLLDGNTAVTNCFTNTAGNVSFATNAVFTDMKIKFYPLADVDVPSSDTLQTCKLAIYVNANSNLVAAVYGTPCKYNTNAIALNLSNWYQMTVRLNNGLFNVLTNDVPAFTGLSLNNSVGVQNALSNIVISGAGSLDELYVSYGNPAYVGTMGGVPPASLGSFPTNVDASVTNWLANFFNNGSLVSSGAVFSQFNKSQLDAAFLLGILGGTSTNPEPTTNLFSVVSINMTSPTNVTLVCSLTTNSAPFTGVSIVGGIQLQGKQSWAATSWTNVSDVLTPSFVSGSATCNFTVTNGYHFFHPLIVKRP